MKERTKGLLQGIRDGRIESPSDKLKEILSEVKGPDGLLYSRYDYDNRDKDGYGGPLREEIGKSLLESNEETKENPSRQFNISVYNVDFKIGQETTDTLAQKVQKIGSSGIIRGFERALQEQKRAQALGEDKKPSKLEALAKSFNDAVDRGYSGFNEAQNIQFKARYNPDLLTTEVDGKTGIERAVRAYSYNRDPGMRTGVFGEFLDGYQMSRRDAQKVITHQSSKSSGLIEAVREDTARRGLLGMAGDANNIFEAMEFIDKKDRYNEVTRVHPKTGKSALDEALLSPNNADKIVGAIHSSVAEKDKPAVRVAYSEMVRQRSKEAGAEAFEKVQKGDESALPELAKKDFNTFLEFIQLEKNPEQWAGIILNEDEKGNSIWKDTFDHRVKREVVQESRDILDRLVGRSIANIELNGSEELRNTPIKVGGYGGQEIIPAKLKEEGRSGDDIDKSFDDRMLFGEELMNAYKKEYSNIQKQKQAESVPQEISISSNDSTKSGGSHVARLKREDSQGSIASSVSSISESSSSFVDSVTKQTKQLGL